MAWFGVVLSGIGIEMLVLVLLVHQRSGQQSKFGGIGPRLKSSFINRVGLFLKPPGLVFTVFEPGRRHGSCGVADPSPFLSWIQP
jgi:hypothetical protein